MTLSRRLALALLVASPLASSPRRGRADGPPLVAAAADLAFALADIVALFTRETGMTVRVVYGASGHFAQQIENGAPFALFLSADESYPRALAAKGLTEGEGVVYAEGKLVLFARTGAAFTPDPALAGLRAALAAGKLGKVALANPAHAPYGRAAAAVLQGAGLTEALAPHLVYGESVEQAAAFVESGAAEGGFLPLALCLPPAPLAAQGRFAEIPPAAYRAAPLRQRMVLIKGAGREAAAFYRFLQGETARQVLLRYGFSVPSQEQ
jgi:molybdate transport system substrate-binding protein